MTKTPLMFAFGIHPVGPFKGDQNFFKRAIGSYVDRILEEKRQAIIIRELPNGPGFIERFYKKKSEVNPFVKPREIKDYFERGEQEEIKKSLEEALRKCELFIDLTYRRSINKGDTQYCKGWGYENNVSKINKNNNGTIRTIAEPQDLDVLTLNLEADFLDKMTRITEGEEKLRYFARLILKTTKRDYRRDLNVRDLALKLRAENPERAIIVPRGYLHRYMVDTLFDRNSFDISVALSNCFEKPSDPIRESYYNDEEITPENLRLAALGDFLVRSHLNRRMRSPVVRAFSKINSPFLGLELLTGLSSRSVVKRLEEFEKTGELPAELYS